MLISDFFSPSIFCFVCQEIEWHLLFRSREAMFNFIIMETFGEYLTFLLAIHWRTRRDLFFHDEASQSFCKRDKNMNW